MAAILMVGLLCQTALAQPPRKKVVKKPYVEVPPAEKVFNPYAEVDTKALQLPDSMASSTSSIASYITSHFTTQENRARAIFVWLATHIRYDIEKMYAINFKKDNGETIAKALQDRKGICEDYALLFQDICTKAGIPCYEIGGYTRQNGHTDYLTHAWNAAFIDTAWYMFDATWASGHEINGKYNHHLNEGFFKIPPRAFIATHMPFDPLWQFLHSPVTANDFYSNNTAEKQTGGYFNFQDSIKLHEKLDIPHQLNAEARRIVANGVKNSILIARLQDLTLEELRLVQNEKIQLYNTANTDYNRAINAFNEFIAYRNKHFLPQKTDAEIQAMLTGAASSLQQTKTKLAAIKEPDVNMEASLKEYSKTISEFEKQLKEQQDWLLLYFSKNKLGRKLMTGW